MALDIEKEARVFLDSVLPSDVSPVQRDEMFKAFVSGWAAAFLWHSTVLPSMGDDDGVKALEDQEEHIKDIFRKMGGDDNGH